MKNEKLPNLVIGDKIINIPIVQGGMGVRVSNASLVSAVCNQGGIGVIASVGLGEEGSKELTYRERSRKALRDMIREVKQLTSNPFGVNIMCALNNYAELVAICDEEEVDFIFSGAGLPLSLPSLIKNDNTKLVPIISSSRALNVICKAWQRRYNKLPDAFVLEGPLAGGHVGFSLEELNNLETVKLEDLLKDVLNTLKSYESIKHIPVIAAGGIFDGKDIAKFLKIGAEGIQMGSRFVCTKECDVSDAYKNEYLQAKKEDIIIVPSPAKMPARVIKNKFIQRMLDGEKVTFNCPYLCLRTCEPNKTQYCIGQALISAYRGDMDNGFAMSGANTYRIDKIVTVKELMDELVKEAIENLS